MSQDNEQRKARRPAVVKTAWLLATVVLGIYLFFIGRAFIQGGI